MCLFCFYIKSYILVEYLIIQDIQHLQYFQRMVICFYIIINGENATSQKHIKNDRGHFRAISEIVEFLS